MRASILAALFPQWRDRDARLCREIVARGICAPTSDLGVAVRATLARVDALRDQRAVLYDRWLETDRALTKVAQERDWARHAALSLGSREKDRARIAELESALAGRRIIIADLRVRLARELAERDEARVERDDARAELAALRDRVKDVAERMAVEVQEVSNG